VAWYSLDKSIAGSWARFTVFPVLPLAAFSHAASEPRLAPMLVLAFFLVEMFDSFSLLGGKLYGRTPLVPRLSPRKTWEGLATGAGATLLAILALVAWLGLPLLPMLIAGLVVVISAIAGDLLGSLAKRRAGVKDYPAVMTVQGGLLDITDAWLVAGPCLAGLAVLQGWH
jgi:phosphatidate cytidylyltransferase